MGKVTAIVDGELVKVELSDVQDTHIAITGGTHIGTSKQVSTVYFPKLDTSDTMRIVALAQRSYAIDCQRKIADLLKVKAGVKHSTGAVSTATVISL